jgi:hypothetical protein
MMGRDPFDLDALRAGIEQAQQLKLAERRKWRRHFVLVPWEWVVRLRTARRIRTSTYLLVLLLLYEHWRGGGRPIVLSNVLAAEIGLSRYAKRRALIGLKQLDLVDVEQRGKQSPRVRLRHCSLRL